MKMNKTLKELTERYSTLEGAKEYWNAYIQSIDDECVELGSSEWLFNMVVETTMRNLQALEVYKKKYGKLSLEDMKLLDDKKTEK